MPSQAAWLRPSCYTSLKEFALRLEQIALASNLDAETAEGELKAFLATPAPDAAGERDTILQCAKELMEFLGYGVEYANEHEDVIEDGFGSVWHRRCPECKLKTMSVVRPGKVQCDFCNSRGFALTQILDAAPQPPEKAGAAETHKCDSDCYHYRPQPTPPPQGPGREQTHPLDAEHFAKLLVDDLEKETTLAGKYEYAAGYVDGLLDSAFQLGRSASHPVEGKARPTLDECIEVAKEVVKTHSTCSRECLAVSVAASVWDKIDDAAQFFRPRSLKG